MRLGVFGGRFDPVHIGHIILAQDVMEQVYLDRILFLLSFAPPHKEASLKFEDREKLLRAALRDFPYFEVCTLEKELQLKKSYTALVLSYLKKNFMGDDLFFIMGEDQFVKIDTWYKPEDIFQLAKIIVLKRNDKKMLKQDKDKILYINQRIIEISSTEIRERIKMQLPIDHIVPKGVAEIIKREGFYKNPSL